MLVGGADKTNYYTPKEEQKAEYIEAYRKYMNMRFRKKVVPWIEQYLLIQQQNALYKSLWKLCEPFNEFYSVQIQEIAPYDSGDPCKYQEHTIRFGNESGFTLIDIPDTWTLHAPQDDDQWAVCFCCCLLSVRTETGKQKKIASRKPGTKSAIHGGPHTIEARSDMGMFCPNCGNRMTEGAVFCTNCGAKIQAGTSNICSACGSELPEGTAFCIGCGKAVSQAVPEPMATRQAAASTPPQGGTGLVGFSDRCYSQEILAAAQKNMRIGIRFMFVLAILPLIGFPVAGLLIDEMPLGEAVIIGAVLSFIMLVINLLTLQGSKQPMWEGVVVNKYSKIEYKHRGEDSESYTAFYTVIHTDAGKKKIINEGESRRHMYDYLSVGDRVRYHPSFGTYEKYDKSGDRIIYCNVCTTMSPIQNDRCKKCNNLLFK